MKCPRASVSLLVHNEKWGGRSWVDGRGEGNNFLFLLNRARTKCDLIFSFNYFKFLAYHTNAPISHGYGVQIRLSVHFHSLLPTIYPVRRFSSLPAFPWSCPRSVTVVVRAVTSSPSSSFLRSTCFPEPHGFWPPSASPAWNLAFPPLRVATWFPLFVCCCFSVPSVIRTSPSPRLFPITLQNTPFAPASVVLPPGFVSSLVVSPSQILLARKSSRSCVTSAELLLTTATRADFTCLGRGAGSSID